MSFKVFVILANRACPLANTFCRRASAACRASMLYILYVCAMRMKKMHHHMVHQRKQRRPHISTQHIYISM